MPNFTFFGFLFFQIISSLIFNWCLFEANEESLVRYDDAHALWIFSADAMATPNSSTSFVEELHKRWFDNVKDYMDKKKEREEGIETNKKKIKTNQD